MKLRIEPATHAHAEMLAPLVRQVEVEEVAAVDGASPLAALVYGVERSDPAYTAFMGEDIAAMWGVVPEGYSVLRGRVGAAWLLTAPIIERFPVLFMRGCRAEIPKLCALYGSLHNAIDVRHSQAIRWAERLGFRLDPPEPYGHAGRPARRFRLGEEALRV